MVRISNFELIKVLERNGRESYTNLAKRFKVTEAAIRKRIKEMEKRGIIKKFRADIDYKKVDMVDAIVGVDTSPEEYLNVIDKLKKSKEIFSLATSSGDHQIMFEASFKDSTEMKKFMDKLQNTKGVTRICPAVLLERIK